MAKKLTLEQTGWIVTGNVLCQSWYGYRGTIEMDWVFIPFGHLSKTALLKSVNDARFGCERIVGADLEIAEQYGPGHLANWREVHLSEARCGLGKRGI